MDARDRFARIPWPAIGGGSTLIAAISVATGAAQRHLEHESVEFLPLAAVALAQWWFWAAVAPVVWALDRRFPWTGTARRRAATVHFAAAVVTAIVHTVILVTIERLAYPPTDPSWTWSRWFRGTLASRGVLDLFVYFGLLALARVLDGQAQLRHRELAAAELEGELAQARLHLLQMQLQPHFLFNTLHAVGVLTRDHPETATRMIAALGDLLRASLAVQSTQEVPLAEELALLDHYLEIETTRFSDRLTVTIEVADDARHLLVPTFVLQPVVENAVRYGIAPRSDAGRVVIRAEREDGRLRLSVWNDGPPPASPPPREGVGLGTTRARLMRLYGDAGRLELRSGVAGGVETRIEIPAHDQPT
jgi:signal transduction histidine kinase